MVLMSSFQASLGECREEKSTRSVEVSGKYLAFETCREGINFLPHLPKIQGYLLSNSYVLTLLYNGLVSPASSRSPRPM